MSNVQDKLKAKEGYRILLLNSPLEQKVIFPEHDKFRITSKPEQECDLVLLFVNSCAELSARIDPAIKSLKNDGILWIAYPKQTESMVKRKMTPLS